MLLIQVNSPLNYKYGNKIPDDENHAKLPRAAAVRLMSRECPG
jgi:hypothetical protein